MIDEAMVKTAEKMLALARMSDRLIGTGDAYSMYFKQFVFLLRIESSNPTQFVEPADSSPTRPTYSEVDKKTPACAGV